LSAKLSFKLANDAGVGGCEDGAVGRTSLNGGAVLAPSKWMLVCGCDGLECAVGSASPDGEPLLGCVSRRELAAMTSWHRRFIWFAMFCCGTASTEPLMLIGELCVRAG